MNIKEYKVLGLTDANMYGTEQRIAVFELAEVVVLDFNLSSELKTRVTETEGKNFIIDYDCQLAQDIMADAQKMTWMTLGKKLNFKKVDMR